MRSRRNSAASAAAGAASAPHAIRAAVNRRVMMSSNLGYVPRRLSLDAGEYYGAFDDHP